MVFVAAGAAIGLWLLIDGSGGGKEPAKMRSGAEEVDQAAQANVASDGHDWRGQAAQSYGDRQATLAGLQQLMADTDNKVAAALETHDEQLATTRNVLDAADITITACTPLAAALLAIPGVGPVLSLKFQLQVAMRLLAGCNTAQQQAQQSSTNTASHIDIAADAYRYIHTTATQFS